MQMRSRGAVHAALDAPPEHARLCASIGAIVRLRDGRAVALRSARPADAEAVQQFVRMLSPATRRRRFLGAVNELSPDQLDRLTRAQGPQDTSLVAVAADAGGPCIVAMAQYAVCAAPEAEFAVVVTDRWQRLGLGVRLVETLLARAAGAGVRAMNGFVLAENTPMLALLTKLGFSVSRDRDPDLVRVDRPLRPQGWMARLAGRLRRPVAHP
jgi:acetyltransferase